MNSDADRLVCRWCAEPFFRTATRGPIPKWCGESCRQSAWRFNEQIRAVEALVDDPDRLAQIRRLIDVDRLHDAAQLLDQAQRP